MSMDDLHSLQAPITRLVQKHTPDPCREIANERQRASFQVERLAVLLNGSKDAIAKRCVL